MHLRQQLSRLGYNLAGMATAGQDALRKIDEVRPDLVLMDIHLEGAMDGIETAGRIPDELQLPVIYLTAHSENATLERARQTKPYGYLLKPFSERELHAVIQMALERRRSDAVISENALRLEQSVAERTQELVAANRALEERTRDLLNAERALSHSQKMEAVGQLAGGIAHDFNNHMQVVVGHLSLLEHDLPHDATRLRGSVERALARAMRAAGVTQRLLSFSRRQMLRPRLVSVNALIAGASELLAGVIGGSIGVETSLCPGPAMVHIDPHELETAILNLAINARDAMPDGGALTLRTENVMLDRAPTEGGESISGDFVKLSVSDTGTGIDEAMIGRVFEPFFTTKPQGKGTGLGLSQVYGFVRQSGGLVKLLSRVGIGTTVDIYLPRQMEASAEPPGRSEDLLPRGRRMERILVVEDDNEVRAFSAEVLRGLGYEVLEMSDGPAALALLRRRSVDLLFTDVVMPGGMTGPKLAAQALVVCPAMKVLFTTGAAFDESGMGSSIALIAKPFSLATLAARVRDIIDGREAAPSLG
jgi:signal transduction histidine kinase